MSIVEQLGHVSLVAHLKVAKLATRDQNADAKAAGEAKIPAKANEEARIVPAVSVPTVPPMPKPALELDDDEDDETQIGRDDEAEEGDGQNPAVDS